MARKLSLGEEVESGICGDYEGGLPTGKLAIKYKICVPSVTKILVKNKVRIRQPGEWAMVGVLSEDQKQEAMSLYRGGETIPMLAKRYSVTVSAIATLLKRRGVEIRTGRAQRVGLTLDESAFETITPESAYWVGFLMADGCIHARDGHSPNLSVGLAKTDEGHLEKLKAFLKCSNKIVTIHSKPSKKQTNHNCTTSVSFHVTSTRICESLARFGLTPRKSFTAKVIGLENNRDFWRGAIDGDGSIFWSEGRHNICLVGSFDLITQFRSYVDLICPETKAEIKKRESETVYRFSAHGRHATKIIDALYTDCVVALDRKLVLAKSVLNSHIEYVEPSYPDLKWERLVELYKEHGAWCRVAKTLGMSNAWVSKMVRKFSPNPIDPNVRVEREEVRTRSDYGNPANPKGAEPMAKKRPGSNDEPRKRDKPVRLDLTAPDYARLERCARERGLNLSSYARMAVLERIKADEG